ncbi:hypothetical protein [Egbenema bharatensis]|uniref:hypothetical protein n=1 Tax=Egbenema bharatensis TaxID=3463334 RepID=UPI003A846663
MISYCDQIGFRNSVLYCFVLSIAATNGHNVTECNDRCQSVSPEADDLCCSTFVALRAYLKTH